MIAHALFRLVTSLLITCCVVSHAAAQPVDIRRHPEFSEQLVGQDGALIFVRMDPSSETKADGFFTRYHQAFGLDSTSEMVEVSSSAGIEKFRHHRFQQVQGSIPVLDGEYVVTTFDDKVVWALGSVVSKLSRLPTAKLSQEKALALARSALLLHLNGGLVGEQRSARLVISRRGQVDRISRLQYEFLLGSNYVTVDAVNGEVLAIYSSVRMSNWVPSDTTGETIANGEQSISVERCQQDLGSIECEPINHFRLHGPTGFVRDNQTKSKSTAGGAIDVITDSGAAEFGANQTAPVTAYWAAQLTYEYLDEVLGRDGLDGNGTPVRMYFNIAEENAFWEDETAWFGHEPGPLGDFPYTAVDVTAHELGHGLQEYSFGGFSQQLPEAELLGEHFGDVLGVLVEHKAGAVSWIHAESIPNAHHRNFEDPAKTEFLGVPYPNAKWYKDANWKDKSHQDAGVPNHAFYLFSEGTPLTSNVASYSYEIDGIGTDLAGEVSLRNVTSYLGSGADLRVARIGSTLALTEICGDYAKAHLDLDESWNAVGVFAGPSASVPLPPVVEPSEAEKNVSAWNAALNWQLGTGETEWELQISPYPFSDPLAEISSYKVAGQPERTLTNLNQNQLYFWRVKAIRPGQKHECWRPTNTFETGTLVPKPHSPIRKQQVHPWEIPFKWSPIEGALDYRLEISPSPTFHWRVGQFPTTKPKIEDRLAVSSRDTLVNQGKMFWRVRAVGPDDQLSDWSDAAQFATSLPKVDSSTYIPQPLPNPGLAPYYPAIYVWPANLSWAAVKGARKYDVEVAKDDVQFQSPLVTTTVSEPELDYHLAPTFDVIYRLRATPVGPELVLSDPDEILTQRGSLSVSRSFIADSLQHVPDMVDPPNTSFFPPFDCVDEQSDDGLMFAFTSVLNAAAYNFELEPFSADSSGDSLIYHPKYFDNCQVSGPVEPGDTEYCYVPFAASTLVDNQIGFHYTIRAVGPNGSTTNGGARGHYSVQPRVPVPVAVPDGEKGDAFQMTWNYDGAHFGWEWQIFNNATCDGAPMQAELMDTTIFANGGYQTYTKTLSTTGTYSWQARSLIAEGCNQFTGWQWSTCDAFEVQDVQPEPDPQPDGVLACSETAEAGGNFGLDVPVELGKTSGTSTLTLKTFTVPDRLRLYYEGSQIVDTDCIGTGNATVSDAIWTCVAGECQRQVSYSGDSTTINVEVSPNCSGTDDTAWEFSLSCPP